MERKKRKRKREGEEPFCYNKMTNFVTENRGATEKKRDRSRNITMATEVINAGVFVNPSPPAKYLCSFPCS